MRIAFCAAEAVPFAQTGGLGDVCGSLPLALLKEKGIHVTLFLPGYKCIDRKAFRIEAIDRHVSKTALGENIDVYLIEHEYFGGRDGIYGDAQHGDYPDNLERFQYFCAQVLKTIAQLKLKTDILHCHDWHTALIPVYLREHYKHDPFFASMKSMLTIHNMAHQGIFPRTKYPKMHLREELFTHDKLEFFGQINFLKAGIVFSDKITTVSRQYSREIMTKEFGCGLESVLRARRDHVTGILNGISHDVWNPATDRLIEQRYSRDTVVQGKAANKKKLQQLTRLPERAGVPLFSFVSRLVHQKGVDLIIEDMEQMLAMDMHVVILGAGDKEYQKQIKACAEKYPQQLWAKFQFDDKLAHQVYAGADWFLMPSRFEPCGLTQLISLAYGTIPIVSKTGGLVDSVKPFTEVHPDGNGLFLGQFTKNDFLHAVRHAVGLFHDRKKFDHLRQNAMKADFSWGHAAREYLKVYQCLLSE